MKTMDRIKLDYSKVLSFVGEEEIAVQREKATKALKDLEDGTCKGSDFLGWLDLPVHITDDELDRISACANKLREQTDVVVIVGIGGSYLGAKAVIEAMSGSFDAYSGTKVVFAGNNVSEDYLYELQAFLKDKKFGICVISKSGTTTEPAVAFRLLKDQLIEQEGITVARERIVAITDEKKGALRTMSDREGYETFIIPDNVGGRYSVLTPVGLLPLAVAGVDIMELMNGAMGAKESYDLRSFDNPVWLYAAVRNLLYRNGKSMEIFESFEPGFKMFGGWWQQLFGESEGKDGKGIFPVTAEFTADLHSLGQMIQQGQRNLFETVVRFAPPQKKATIEVDWKNLDGLNYLEGKSLDFVEEQAFLGTLAAHVDGGVPVMVLQTDRVSADTLGELFFFFELSCGISAYMLGVNPFNQPGVEFYKKNMFHLLGKPGY